MEELKILSNQNVLGCRFNIYGTFDNPLFLAKDVANWIEHTNPRMMVQSVDDDEKVVNNAYTLGGNQEQWFLTENGLYEVLMLSRKPIAKEFKKEVKKILHQIRLQGSYQVPKTFKDALLLAAHQQEILEQQQAQLLIQAPKVEVYDQIVESKGFKSVEEVGTILGYGRNKFFKALRKNRIFKKVTDGEGCETNLPYQKFIDDGYFVTKESQYLKKGEKHNYTRIFVTGKGEVWLTEYFSTWSKN